MNIGELLTSPSVNAGLITAIVGFCVVKLCEFVSKYLDPAEYIEKLYSSTDKLVETVDDRFIDKYLSDAIKQDLKENIIKVLEQRRDKIDILINNIK